MAHQAIFGFPISIEEWTIKILLKVKAIKKWPLTDQYMNRIICIGFHGSIYNPIDGSVAIVTGHELNMLGF